MPGLGFPEGARHANWEEEQQGGNEEVHAERLLCRRHPTCASGGLPWERLGGCTCLCDTAASLDGSALPSAQPTVSVRATSSSTDPVPGFGQHNLEQVKRSKQAPCKVQVQSYQTKRHLRRHGPPTRLKAGTLRPPCKILQALG